jgi:pimeloyl-ACP methyl ester carboxylesterase
MWGVGRLPWIAAGVLLLASCSTSSIDGMRPSGGASAARLVLEPCRVAGVDEELRCGTFDVPENRMKPNGRTLPLRVVVLPAQSLRPAPEPVFLLAGGPGQAATELAPALARSWERQDRDLVLVDQRGTGEGHRLDCSLGGSDDNPQGYLEPVFQGRLARACRQELEKRADLTQYSTPIAMRDIDDVRKALGYGRINLLGGSYGSRAALVYLRSYGANVHSVFLTSLFPFSNRAPLFQAAETQRAFDVLAGQCAADAACRSALLDVKGDLAAILRQLRERPAKVIVGHPVTKAPVELLLSEEAFGESIRLMLYSAEQARSLPLLLQRARAGDLRPFAEAAMLSNRGARNALRFGLFLSVACTEDTARIRPGEIEAYTANSLLGDHRVRGQMAACAEWPRSKLPADYLSPFRSPVPALLVSGTHDPVIPVGAGEEVRAYLPNSIHLVVPGGHMPRNDCINSIAAELFRSGSIDRLDTSCAPRIPSPAFVLPPASGTAGG